MSDNTKALAQRLAAFAVRTRTSGPPDDVRDSVRLRVLDTVGIALAATRLPTSRAVLDWVAGVGGQGQAQAIGLPDRVPTAQAAFANGVLAHSLDYDDTHLPSILHPSATVVPAAIAAAEQAGASGAELIAAIAGGLEVCVRVGMAGYDRDARNSTFFEHGQHATSICGTLGGAVSAALLFGLDEAGVTSALGIAASMASGIIEGNRTGGTVKRMHCGWAAHGAVVAAELARRGITGPPTALDGRFGLFEAFLHGRYDAEPVLDGLGERWLVPNIFFKPYPANHFTHAAIDAARGLRADGVRAEDIAAVELGVAAPTVRTIGEPLDVKRNPLTGYQAQFSGPYAVAVGWLGGDEIGLAEFTDELAADPARRALMAKVTVVADAECAAVYPDQFPAVLRVSTVDGRRFVRRVMANRGGPQWPMTDDEIAAKFRANGAGVVPADALDAMVAAVRGLDGSVDAGSLLVPACRTALEPVV